MNRLAFLTVAALSIAALTAQSSAYAQSGTGNSIGGTRDAEGATVPNTGGTTPSTNSAPDAVTPDNAAPGVVTPKSQTSRSRNANPNDCSAGAKTNSGAPCATPDSKMAPTEKMGH